MMNLLKQRLQSGQPIINGWFSHGGTYIAELMSKQSYHSITIDTQHGMFDANLCLATLQGIDHRKITPMVRVAANRPELISRALDFGALGIICPMVNTAAQATALVKATYYPSLGERSFGPIRARNIYDNYFANANDNILSLAMVETKEAMANLQAITEVEGLSGIYIGPSDLSLSYGFAPGFDRTEPLILEMLEKIVKQAHAKGKICAIHTQQAEYAYKMIELGMDMVTLGSDLLGLEAGVRDSLDKLYAKLPNSADKQQSKDGDAY